MSISRFIRNSEIRNKFYENIENMKVKYVIYLFHKNESLL